MTAMSARLEKITKNHSFILSFPCVGRYTGGWVFTYGYMPGKCTCLTFMGEGLASTGMCLRVCVLSKILVKVASTAAMKPGLLTFLTIRSKSPPAEGVQDWTVRAMVAVAGGGEGR